MKKFSIILAALATLLFSSCSKTFYQVYQVEGDQMNVTDEAIVFDNDDCSVLYNLWSSGGNMSFLFTNKTDHSLYLIMSESFYIQNGEARDYYKEGAETFTNSYSVSEAAAASATLLGQVNVGWKWYNGNISATNVTRKSSSSSKTITNINPKVICIPPYSSKYITSFSILNQVQLICDNPKRNYPKSYVRVGGPYSKEDSPLTFRNRIAYTTDPESRDFHFIDNFFWVSSYTNYSTKAATEKVEVEQCNTSSRKAISNNGVKMKVFKIDNAHSFYNSYIKKQ